MGYVKTGGIVIREVNTGEADKIITIFSKSKGKISGFAKGARRPKSRFLAGSQFLCYSDFVLYKGKDMYNVSSCDVIEPFYDIRNDVIKLTYSVHMTDLISDIIQENQPAARVLQLFLNALHMLAKTGKSPELITRIFELRLLSMMGYAPRVSGCMVCGEEAVEDVSFSFRQCGFICANCLKEDPYAMGISPGAAKALRYIVYAKMNDLFSFDVSPLVMEELTRVSRRYLRDRLERDYTKLDFLKSLDFEGK